MTAPEDTITSTVLIGNDQVRKKHEHCDGRNVSTVPAL